MTAGSVRMRRLRTFIARPAAVDTESKTRDKDGAWTKTVAAFPSSKIPPTTPITFRTSKTVRAFFRT